jgi:AraC-like DNA-binding protein
MLAQSNKACAACLEMQDKIADPSAHEATSATCFAGLCDTAVPVRVGEQLIGYLQTGQIALTPPSRDKFRRIAAKIVEWGGNVDLKRLEDAYLHSKVLSREQYAGAVRLLEIFAAHLGALGNQLLVQEKASEHPFARRVREYVKGRESEPISLDEISSALHVSTYYFCKMFRKATGLTFTDYLGRVRVERAKTLLLDPNKRVSEVAYEAGFGSLTHFNRVFRKVAGKSPTDYRESLRP